MKADIKLEQSSQVLDIDVNGSFSGNKSRVEYLRVCFK